MSNGQKKKPFRIEAFKHRVVLDPKYAEKTWKILDHAIHEIYNRNASGLSFEELYRFVCCFLPQFVQVYSRSFRFRHRLLITTLLEVIWARRLPLLFIWSIVI